MIEVRNTRLQEVQQLLLQTIQEKEILHREIHHRVKNNMQMIMSILKIQSKTSKNLNIDEFIANSENRIRAMALIHEYLYESEHFNHVNFEKYLNKLTETIQLLHKDFKNITVKAALQSVKLSIHTSISLGIIINELFLNAYKYAFTGQDKGIIKIQLFLEQAEYYLVFEDNGVGFEAGNTLIQSSGLQIVDLLVCQLGGVMDIKSDAGTQIIIKFKELNLVHA
jgi:two-component sensor histidine kinase